MRVLWAEVSLVVVSWLSLVRQVARLPTPSHPRPSITTACLAVPVLCCIHQASLSFRSRFHCPLVSLQSYIVRFAILQRPTTEYIRAATSLHRALHRLRSRACRKRIFHCSCHHKVRKLNISGVSALSGGCIAGHSLTAASQTAFRLTATTPHV
jgi:hypothetical protein